MAGTPSAISNMKKALRVPAVESSPSPNIARSNPMHDCVLSRRSAKNLNSIAFFMDIIRISFQLLTAHA